MYEVSIDAQKIKNLSESDADELVRLLDRLGVESDYAEAERDEADEEEETLYELEKRMYNYGRI